MAQIISEEMDIDEGSKITNVKTVVVRQVEFYSEIGSGKEVKENCLNMYVNGNGFRAIERITKVNHNTVIRWVKETGKKLLNYKNDYLIPLVGQIDELQTFIGRTTNRIWIWTALNKDYSEILEYIIGDRSGETFAKLWPKIKGWNCYFWITDG